MASRTISTILNLRDNFSARIRTTTNNTRQFQRQMRQATNTAREMKNKISASFGGLALKVGGVFAGLGIANFAKDSLMLASNLKEVQNVVDTTFGKMSSKINDFASKASANFGMSELQAKQFAGTLGAMMKSSGITGNKLTTMSTNLAALAGDFASFYNLDPAEAFEKIKAGMVGSTEPLLSLGINMQVASMEAYALSQGIKKSWKSMSEAEKQTLRYNYLLEKSKDAQGDYAKTHAGFANSLRTLQLKIKDVGASLMSYTIPAFESLFGKMIEFADMAKPVTDNVANKLKSLWVQFEVGNKIDNVKNTIANVFEEVKNTIAQAKQPVSDFINAVLEFAKTVWGDIQPAVNYIKNNIIPDAWDKVKAAIAGILDIATRTFNFINTNWATIKPLILGIAIAWGTYKAVMTGVQLITNLLIVKQMILNAVMNANPIGLIITGIGLLIGAGILLYQNWDAVKAKAFQLWEGIKTAFSPIASFFSGIWEGVKSGFKGFINFLITGINFYTGTLNWIPKLLSKVPGFGWAANFNIPQIPQFALGTQYFKGGLARINERGGEIVNLPNGSQVIPSDKSERILNNNKGININVIIQGNLIGNEEYANYVGGVIVNKVKLALVNM